MDTPADTGKRFVAALAAKDTATLVGMFAADVRFLAVTPRHTWSADTPEQIVHDVLYTWFEPADTIEAVERVETGTVVDRNRVDYRLSVRNPDGLFTVEQRAYYDLDDVGRITRMNAMCAGFRPVAAAP